MKSAAVKYGLVVAAALFVMGWLTGMGGSPLPNLLFSLAMGVFAAGLYALVQKFAARKPHE